MDASLINEAIYVSTIIFYSIGGSILVVLAGFWSFSKVMQLLTGASGSNNGQGAERRGGSSDFSNDAYDNYHSRPNQRDK